MKLALPIALAGCLAIGNAAVHAESQSLNSFPNHVLPVLVRVDSHGKVTDVSPAVELTPHYERLLRATLDEMITRPASDHGKPVASQFVIKLGLQARPRSDGRYDASFFYVAAQPVPAGRWIWQHEDGDRLALVNSEMIRNRFKHRWTNNGWFAPPPGLSAPRNPPPTPRANCTSAGHSGKP